MKTVDIAASHLVDSEGFTLVELLIVVSILVMVFGLTIASFNSFNRRQRLLQTALNFKSGLRFAQTRAISAEKPASNCTTFVGIHVTFTVSGYSIQHACTPEGDVGIIEETILPQGITFGSLPTGFTFKTLTRTVDQASDQTVTFTNASQTYAVEITANGEVNDLGFLVN